jgi:hypothetical protein
LESRVEHDGTPASLGAVCFSTLTTTRYVQDRLQLGQDNTLAVRIEELEDPLMRNIRYLDKLVDELAKDRPMEKILRQ